MRISKDIYTGLVPAFYKALASTDEDNTSLRSIIGSFGIQVLPSDIAQITNIPNEGVFCRSGERWWIELGTTEEDVAEILTTKRVCM